MFSGDRQQSHSRRQPEAHPGSDLDPDPALLHLHAHVGRRGGKRGEGAGHSQATVAGVDPEQDPRDAHHQLQGQLAGRYRAGSAGRQLRPR